MQLPGRRHRLGQGSAENCGPVRIRLPGWGSGRGSSRPTIRARGRRSRMPSNSMSASAVAAGWGTAPSFQQAIADCRELGWSSATRWSRSRRRRPRGRRTPGPPVGVGVQFGPGDGAPAQVIAGASGNPWAISEIWVLMGAVFSRPATMSVATLGFEDPSGLSTNIVVICSSARRARAAGSTSLWMCR